jgi:hypothetical protein
MGLTAEQGDCFFMAYQLILCGTVGEGHLHKGRCYYKLTTIYEIIGSFSLCDNITTGNRSPPVVRDTSRYMGYDDG